MNKNLRKKLHNKQGQSIVEYIVLVAAVITALIFFLGSGGAFRSSLEKVLGTQGDTITGDADRIFK